MGILNWVVDHPFCRSLASNDPSLCNCFKEWCQVRCHWNAAGKFSKERKSGKDGRSLIHQQVVADVEKNGTHHCCTLLAVSACILDRIVL
eukprot:1161189-Pelagomonas_calceolata.AAC.9